MSIVYNIEKDPVYHQGKEQGIKQGEKRGEEKGRRTQVLEIARTMKQAGEPLEKIIAYTQLSAAEVEQL